MQHQTPSCRTIHPSRRRRGGVILGAVAFVVGMLGCAPQNRRTAALYQYYDYDFTTARERLRPLAEAKPDNDTVLNNLRLGVASLADGNRDETERTLLRVFDLLSTAGLNEDRTTTAVFLTNEGIRIWKGEPFEQALAYHYMSTFYATLGDWENMRAAAANALFRLTDFGRDAQQERLDDASLARRSVEDPEYLEEGYTAVDTNFTLGFLMQAIGSDLSGLGGADRQFDAALEINPDLEPIVTKLRERRYDTLLIVDYGHGPEKIAYGPDRVFTRFEPMDRAGQRLLVHADDLLIAGFASVANVNRMSIDHRWNNLEDVRKAKSALGNALLAGGAIATAVGDASDTDEAVYAGLGAMVLGALTKSGAAADTRYFEFAPAEVFLMPLELQDERDLELTVEAYPTVRFALPDFQPGTRDNPRVVYLRLHGPDSPTPRWMTSTNLAYTNDFAEPRPGAAPWVLGGRDVSSPTPKTLSAYRHRPSLSNLAHFELRDLYREEGIFVGAGMAPPQSGLLDASYRHILEGGRGLFTPMPYSMGYKRLMYTPVPQYLPRSAFAESLMQHVHAKEAASRSTTDAQPAEEFSP